MLSGASTVDGGEVENAILIRPAGTPGTLSRHDSGKDR